MAQLAMFAEAVGQDERAAAWANKGLDLALATNQSLVFLELSLNTIPSSLSRAGIVKSLMSRWRWE